MYIQQMSILFFNEYTHTYAIYVLMIPFLGRFVIFA